MEISGIGNQILSEYTSASQSEATVDTFKQALDAAVAKSDDQELMEACQSFEAYYIQQLFKEMRKTIPDGGLFETSTTLDTYEEMLDSELSDVMSQRNGFGIADAMYRQLSKDSSNES